MQKVQAIYHYTIELLDLLEKEVDRDQKIPLIQELLEKRERELNKLTSPYTEEEMEQGRLLVNLNKKLEILLSREKLLIQKDIKDLHAKKMSSQKYSNPYEGLSIGGVFYDKRK